MDADVGAVITVAAQRHHLRAEPLDDPLRHVPGEQRRHGAERKAQHLRRSRERASALVAQAARRETQRIERVRRETGGDRQPGRVGIVGPDAKIVHRRRDAQRIARGDDVERRRCCGECEHDAAAAHAGAGIVRIVLRRALRQPVADRAVIAVAAGEAGERERGRGVQPQGEDRVVEARRIRQAQPQDRQPLVGQRLVQHDEIGLPVGAVAPFQRANVEIGAGQRLPAGRVDAGQWTQLDGQQPRQRRPVHRLGEGEADRVEAGDAFRLVFGRGRHRLGQQRHQGGAAAGGADRDRAQRRPRLGGAELQHARPEPLPRPRLRRLHGDEAGGRVLGCRLRRAGVGGEEHRHRVPRAQEPVRHHQRAIRPLRLAGRRRGAGGWNTQQQGQQQQADEHHHARDLHGAAAGGAKPAASSRRRTTSGGGGVMCGSMPSTVGRTSVVRPLGGTLASSR